MTVGDRPPAACRGPDAAYDDYSWRIDANLRKNQVPECTWSNRTSLIGGNEMQDPEATKCIIVVNRRSRRQGRTATADRAKERFGEMPIPESRQQDQQSVFLVTTELGLKRTLKAEPRRRSFLQK